MVLLCDLSALRAEINSSGLLYSSRRTRCHAGLVARYESEEAHREQGQCHDEPDDGVLQLSGHVKDQASPACGIRTVIQGKDPWHKHQRDIVAGQPKSCSLCSAAKP